MWMRYSWATSIETLLANPEIGAEMGPARKTARENEFRFNVFQRR